MSLFRLNRWIGDRKPPRPSGGDRRRRNRARPSLESLENREVLSISVPMPPTVFGAPDVPFVAGPQVDQQGVNVPNWYNLDIMSDANSDEMITENMLPQMENLQLTGALPQTYTTTKVFQVYLTQGQVIESTLNVKYNYQLGSTLYQTQNHSGNYSVLGPDGTYVADSYVMNSSLYGDGTAADEPSFVFKAPTTGVYQFQVYNLGTPSFAGTILPESYTAYLRTIRPGLQTDSQLDPNSNPADASTLNFAGGGLYAWYSSKSDSYDPTVASSTPMPGYLTFSGPTGRFFEIEGTWAETSDGKGTNTYTATGSLTLESAAGGVTLPLARGTSFVVTTSGLDGTNLYGLVDSTKFGIQNLPFRQISSAVGQDFGISDAAFTSDFGSSAAQPDIAKESWGINLGAAVSALTGAPLDPAVPYIYLAANAPASITYGSITASVDATGVGAGFNLAIDPADPMIYVNVSGIPGLNSFSLAGSQNDLIPYTPEYTPTNWKGSFYGDLYIQGTLNLGDLTDEEIPVTLAGDVTLNLDPYHKGLSALASAIASEFGGKAPSSASNLSISQLTSYLDNISIGVDGTASLSVSKDGFNFSVPMGGASAIWDGPQDSFYFHGWANTMTNGLPGALENQGQITVDGFYDAEDQAFDVNLASSFTMLDTTLQGSIDVSSSGIVLDAQLSLDTGNVNFGIGSFDASGAVNVSIGFGYNGELTFGFYVGLTADLDIFGDDLSWSDSYSYSASVNLAALGGSIWDDIKHDVIDEVESVF